MISVILSCISINAASTSQSKVFNDLNLEKAVRKQCGKTKGVLTINDIKKINYLNASSCNISSLEGIEQLTNLKAVILDDNKIINISPLKFLDNLNELSINNNSISDISSLVDLKNLTKLNLGLNKIRDISTITSLNKLSQLYLAGNPIENYDPLKKISDSIKYGDIEYIENFKLTSEGESYANRINRLDKSVVMLVGSPKYMKNNKVGVIDKSSTKLTPSVVNGIIFVPLSIITNIYGKKVNYDKATSKISIEIGKNTYGFVVGSKKFFVNNDEMELDVPVKTINNSIYLPLKTCVENLLSKKLIIDSNIIIISDEENVLHVNNDKDILSDLRIQLANQEENSMFVICNDQKKYGYIDENGKVIVQPIYSNAFEFSDGLGSVRYKGLDGFVNKTGKLVIKNQFYAAVGFHEGYCEVNNGKEVFGYISKQGKYVVKPQFEWSLNSDFSDGLACVKPVGSDTIYSLGYIDTTGKMVIKPKFDVASKFTEGLAAVRGSSIYKFGYINKKGDFVIETKFDWAYEFVNGIACVNINNKYGFINKKGDYVIPPIYDDASSFSEGYAYVKKDGYWWYINQKGQVMFNTNNDDEYLMEDYSFHEGLALFKYNGKYGYINKKGEVVIMPQYDHMGNDSGKEFRNGCVRVILGDRWVYINKDGEVIYKANSTFF